MKSLINHLKSLRINSFNPILITDIDGVLVRGSTPIKSTLSALIKLKQNNIPFACLTNGGGQLQQSKAKKLNCIFELQNYFSGQYMFMNHTPLKPQLVKHSQKGQIILVTGSLDIQSILQQLNIKNYITCDQFYTLFHQKDHQSTKYKLQPNQDFPSFYHRNQNYSNTVQKLQKRFKKLIPNNFQQWINSISSIFALNDVSPYQTALQVIHIILQNKKKNKQQMPAYFAAQNDIIWAGGYQKSRMAFGPFNYLLKSHCQTHKFNLQQIYYGKPELKAFKFVQKQMRKKIKNNEDAVFFMVGDNPRADIKGANLAGWGSFLTKTGIHQKDQNDIQNPATVVVKDFAEAIQMLIELKSKKQLYV